MAAQPATDYRIYADLADWWPLISPPKDYTAEAAYLAAILRHHAGPGPAGPGPAAPAGPRPAGPAGPGGLPEVLDLGSGGGHVAVHLRDEFSLTLVDLSNQMLTVSKQLNPDSPHIHGDMRTIRLHRMFDAVLVHDAIDYIIGQDDLRQVIDTAAAHTRPGGIALFVPDYVQDTFHELFGSGGGGVDAAGRTADFTERTWDPDLGDDCVQADYEFRLVEADGTTRVIHESHQLSSFSRELWRDLIKRAGFELADWPTPATGHQSATGQPANLFIGLKQPQ
ncbi:MAG TPA: class I SAM-dependent methyltransferase [Streptosporangiaceae bacterium]|jgi:SAM-dependent methyltransferase|nr:class I SAM-dependent methyltransferase [Streptosporangiaceae bacterium]